MALPAPLHFSITIGGRDQRRDRKPPRQEEWERTRPSFYSNELQPAPQPASAAPADLFPAPSPAWPWTGAPADWAPLPWTGGGWPAAVPGPVWGWAGGPRGAGAMWSQDFGGPGRDRPGLAGFTAGWQGWTWGCRTAPVLGGGCDYYHDSPAGGGALPPATFRVGASANAAGLGASGPGGVGRRRRGGGGRRDAAGGCRGGAGHDAPPPPSAVPQSAVAPLRLLPPMLLSPVAAAGRGLGAASLGP